MNKKSKILSAFVAAAIIILNFNSLWVFADGEETIPIDVGFEVKNSEVTLGEVFPINVKFNFDEQQFSSDNQATAGGIVVFRLGVRFNPDYLYLADPETLKPIEISESGDPREGTFFRFGNNGISSNLSVKMNSDGKTLVLLYVSQEEDGDIYMPGAIAQIAFGVKEDIEVQDADYTSIEMVNPEVSVNNRNIKLDITKKDQNLKIIPPYSISNIGSKRQNETLTATGSCYLGTDSEEPLMAKIIQGDNVIGAEKQADLTDTRFKVSFDLPETDFPTGNYKLVLSHGKTSLSRSFEVLPKLTPAEPTTPDPSGPTDPDDGKRDDDKKDDNNTGGGTNTGGSRNNGTGGTNQTKPDNTAESNKPADSGNKPQATIKYPSDLAGHWAESNVKYVYDNALMNGYSDGTFKPDASITRAEFSAVMARFLKLDDKASAAEKFGDVKGHWAIGYIGALADKGIVGGVTENSFAPDDNITREQMAAILSRAFDLKETSPEVFADNGEISDWARDYVYACRKAGYMNGDAVNNFSPLDNASRAEVATVIYRLHSAK